MWSVLFLHCHLPRPSSFGQPFTNKRFSHPHQKEFLYDIHSSIFLLKSNYLFKLKFTFEKSAPKTNTIEFDYLFYGKPCLPFSFVIVLLAWQFIFWQIEEKEWKEAHTSKTSLLQAGLLHCIVLCFTALCGLYIFYKVKVCGNPLSGNSTRAIFNSIFPLCASKSHFGNSQNISNIVISLFVMVWLFWKTRNCVHARQDT